MPRYHFNVHDGLYDPDPDGVLLFDMDAARIQAAIMAAEILREKCSEIWRNQELKLEITDDVGLHLFSLIILTINSPAGCSASAWPVS